jgi:5-methylcytosine-specific restriction protein B
VPVPTLGKISLTKYTSPEKILDALATVNPGHTTAADVEHALGPLGPLWNDLIDYTPPITGRTTAGTQIANDNELLRAARTNAPHRYILFWAALNLADTRLDEITRTHLTDDDGHLNPNLINRDRLCIALNDEEGKVTTNILSLLERCQLIAPIKNSSTIIGVDHTLPTRIAAAPLVTLLTERLAPTGFIPAPTVADSATDFALAIGANAWIGLSRNEFIAALHPTPAIPTPRLPLPADITELATQLHRKRQVVLQGPPGAGKTYLARRYISWATGRHHIDHCRLQTIIDALPENERRIDDIVAEIHRRALNTVWDIVQFHPGYDYTDFVRSLVAEPHANGVTFTPRHKMFSLIAGIGERLRRQNSPTTVVLILDEINRGNIPNIFGELLYALEYRGEAVTTPYAIDGDPSITVPDNLLLIGTMNTADRSIAVIDYALRRRFVFLTVPATDTPIRNYHFDSPTTQSAALHLYETTARALADTPTGLHVGPSYFLADPDGTATAIEVLASRYVYEVLPLLSEYTMEGDLDPTAVTAIRANLALPDIDDQPTQARILATYLSTTPTTPTATE